MENGEFIYNYSAARNKEVQRIRERYLPREKSRMERLRELDARVRGAGMIQGLTIGIIGALIFGVGLCFGLDVFAGGMVPAIGLCAVGALVMLPAYPVYRLLSKRTRERLTPEILRLSDELIGNPTETQSANQ